MTATVPSQQPTCRYSEASLLWSDVFTQIPSCSQGNSHKQHVAVLATRIQACSTYIWVKLQAGKGLLKGSIFKYA